MDLKVSDTAPGNTDPSRAMRSHLPSRRHLTFRQALSGTRIFVTATYSYGRDRAAGGAIIAFGVVAYLLDDGDPEGRPREVEQTGRVC
jgi:hypothetical protein